MNRNMVMAEWSRAREALRAAETLTREHCYADVVGLLVPGMRIDLITSAGLLPLLPSLGGTADKGCHRGRCSMQSNRQEPVLLAV